MPGNEEPGIQLGMGEIDLTCFPAGMTLSFTLRE